MESKIDRLMARIQTLAGSNLQVTHRNRPLSVQLRCTIHPPLVWRSKKLEEVLQVKLPVELVKLWNLTSGLRLFEDMTFGQWGLVFWSAAEVEKYQAETRVGREEDYQKGDLVVAEFLGDADVLVVRCDERKDDFGAIVVAMEMDPRRHWPVVGTSLSDFLQQYLAASGDKFWELPDFGKSRNEGASKA